MSKRERAREILEVLGNAGYGIQDLILLIDLIGEIEMNYDGEGAVKVTEEVKINDTINEMLHELQIPKGPNYTYLSECLLMAYNDNTVLRPATKKLYPQVGVKFNVGAMAVQKGVQRAISESLKNAKTETLKMYFGPDYEKMHLTNDKFLNILIVKMQNILL